MLYYLELFLDIDPSGLALYKEDTNGNFWFKRSFDLNTEIEKEIIDRYGYNPLKINLPWIIYFWKNEKLLPQKIKLISCKLKPSLKCHNRLLCCACKQGV